MRTETTLGCAMCGASPGATASPDAVGHVYCDACVARMEGWEEAHREEADNLLRFAIVARLQAPGGEDATRGAVDAIISAHNAGDLASEDFDPRKV